MSLENKVITHMTIYTDMSGVNTPSYTYAKQYDTNSRYLIIKIMSNGTQYLVTGTTQLNATKPDGTQVFIPGTVNSDGTVTFELTSNLLAVAGVVTCDITIFDTENSSQVLMTTRTFIINVDKSNYNEDAIESTDEFSRVTEALLEMEEIKDEALSAAQDAAESAEYVSGARIPKDLKISNEDHISLLDENGTVIGNGVNLPRSVGIPILDSYDSYEELVEAHPTGSVGDAYSVMDEIYIWSSSINNWKDVGTIRGARGDDGKMGLSLLFASQEPTENFVSEYILPLSAILIDNREIQVGDLVFSPSFSIYHIIDIEQGMYATLDLVNDSTAYITDDPTGSSHSKVVSQYGVNSIYGQIMATMPLVIDNVSSTSSYDALSANQGKLLNDKISALQAAPGFISMWNSATGLPTTPPETSYSYKVGDYYIVSNVSSGTNYKPYGSTYSASGRVIEYSVVSVNDAYFYNGNEWKLIINSARQIVVDSQVLPSSTNPVENRAIYEWGQEKINVVPLTGTSGTVSSDVYNILKNPLTIIDIDGLVFHYCKILTTSSSETIYYSSTSSDTVKTFFVNATARAWSITTEYIPGVLDSLTSSSATNALSAKQGKALKDLIDDLDDSKQEAITDTNKLSPSLIDGLSDVATSGSYSDLTNKPNASNIAYSSTDSRNIKSVVDTINGQIDNLASVAYTGSYNDLSNRPTIPTALSELSNDADYVTFSGIGGESSLYNIPYFGIDGTVILNSGISKDDILTSDDIVDNLTSESSTSVLSAKQGKILYDMIEEGGDINVIDNLTSTSTTDALSANQGRVLKGLIPTKTSQLTNDSGFVYITELSDYIPINRKVNGKALSSDITLNGTDIIIDAVTGSPTISDAVTSLSNNKQDKITSSNKLSSSLVSGLATVATSGSYNDLSNKPSIPAAANNATITIKMNGTNVDSFTVNASTAKTIDLGNVITDVSSYVPTSRTINGKALSSNITLNGTDIIIDAETGSPTISSAFTSLSNNKQDKITSTNKLSYSLISGTPSLATVATSGSYNDLSNKPSIPTVNDATITIKMNDVSKGTFTTNAGTAKTIDLGTVITSHQDISGKQDKITSTNKLPYSLISGTPSLAAVATSGSYNDLSNKPFIPANTSDLVNDSHYITSSALSDYVPTARTVNSKALSSDITLNGTDIIVDAVTGSPTISDAFTSLSNNKQDKITSTNKLSASLVSGLATVATSGSYNDLSDKPTIPSGISGAGVYYGVCSTAAATAAKTVTLSRGDGFALTTGVTVFIKFTATNSAASPTLNVNGTGDKALMQYGTTAMSTNQQSTGWRANSIVALTYDGTNWIRTHWENSVLYYTSVYSTTSATTAAKVGSVSGSFSLDAGKNFQVMMYYSNTKAAALTLNIASTGAKPIYINGQPSSATNYTLPAGEYLVYYDGSNYYFETDGTIRAKNIVADNLSTITDSTPYLLRQSGGDLDVGNREAIKKLVGGTMVWNQLMENSAFATSTGWAKNDSNISISGGICTLTATAQNGLVHHTAPRVNGHIFAYLAEIKTTTATNAVYISSAGSRITTSGSIATTEWQTLFAVRSLTVSTNANIGILDYRASGWDAIQIRKVLVFDLTQMFGTAVANQVLTAETATKWTGYNMIKPFIENASNSYNAGELVSVKTSAHVTKDANDTALGTYPIDNIELRGKLKLDADNKLYYDGDEYASDGTVTRKYAAIDLGTATASMSTNYTNLCFYSVTITGGKDFNVIFDTAVLPLPLGRTAGSFDNAAYIGTASRAGANIVFIGFPVGTTLAQARAAMAGKMFVYELATPKTESTSPLTNPQIIDPNGTEEFVDTRTVPMPVGHETVYLSNTIGNAVGELLQPIKSSSAGFRMLTLAGNSDTLTEQDFADYYTNPSPAHMIYHSGQRQYYYLQTISTGTNYNVYYVCPSSSGSVAARDTIEITPTGYWSLWA